LLVGETEDPPIQVFGMEFLFLLVKGVGAVIAGPTREL
jgi:hypothetical protein